MPVERSLRSLVSILPAEKSAKRKKTTAKLQRRGYCKRGQLMKNWSICSVGIFSYTCSFRNCLIGFNQVMYGNYNRPYGNFTQPFRCFIFLVICSFTTCINKIKVGVSSEGPSWEIGTTTSVYCLTKISFIPPFCFWCHMTDFQLIIYRCITMYNAVGFNIQNIDCCCRFYSDYEKNDTHVVNIRQKKALKKSEKSWGKQQKLSVEGT